MRRVVDQQTIREEDLRYFDLLPRRLREALNRATFKHASFYYYRDVAAGFSVDQLIAYIEWQEAEYLRKNGVAEEA